MNTTNKVTVTHFQSFDDGSGVEMLATARGFRFAASFVAGRVSVHPLSSTNFVSRTARFRIALSQVTATMTARVEALGPEWLAAHRALYELPA